MTREQKIIEKIEELETISNNYSVVDDSYVILKDIVDNWIDSFKEQLSVLESEPPTETYEKVYIKTESDLPEHYDFYCCSLNDDITPCIVEYQYQNRILNNKWWLNNINWYLRPIKH